MQKFYLSTYLLEPSTSYKFITAKHRKLNFGHNLVVDECILYDGFEDQGWHHRDSVIWKPEKNGRFCVKETLVVYSFKTVGRGKLKFWTHTYRNFVRNNFGDAWSRDCNYGNKILAENGQIWTDISR